MVFVDCSTEDLKRLNEEVVALSKELQSVQAKHTEGLDPRDKMIVLQTSILAMDRAVLTIVKKFSTPRFYRSIGAAYRVMRAFRIRPEVK